jgi:hypothetical protein
MTEKQDITSHESTEAQSQEQRPPTALRPPVDIFEDAEGITLERCVPTERPSQEGRGQGRIQRRFFMPTSMHERPCSLNGIGQDRGNLSGYGG